MALDLQNACFFTIMADECTDSANEEELVLCFRWIDNHLEMHEEFIGLYQISDVSADTIVAVIEVKVQSSSKSSNGNFQFLLWYMSW